MPQKIQKKISDLVDMEWFLALDAENRSVDAPDPSLLASLSPEMSDAACMGLWLDAHRKKARAGGMRLLPGEVVLLVWRACAVLLGCLGFLAGFSMALGVLHYDGQTPVNLMYAFLVLVGLPFLTVVLTLLLLFFRKKSLSVGHRVFLSLVSSLVLRLLTKAGQRMPVRMQDILQVRGRQLERFSSRYQSFVMGLLFFVFQLGGLALVLGMCCAFLLKVVGADLAFAWQSTLAPGTDLIHALIQALAFPWRFLLPHTLPDPVQIEGSRVILKEGISALDARHLTSWWPFLCMAILVYGLAPRMLLFFFSFWRMQRCALDTEVLDSRVQRLCFFLRRTALAEGKGRGRDVSFSGPDAADDGEKAPQKESPLKDASEEASGVFYPALPWELWIVDETQEDLHGRITEDAARVMGGPPSRVLVVDMEALPDFSGGAACRLVLALEVFMPPVREDLDLLHGLARKNPGAFWIWPVGKPAGEGKLRAPESHALRVWAQKLESLPEPRPLLHQEVECGC